MAVAIFNKFVASSFVTLVAATALLSPSHSEAATSKKKPHAAPSAKSAKASVHASRQPVAHLGRVARASRHVAALHAPAGLRKVAHFEPAHPSFGYLYGLHNTADSLALKSSVALVVDADTDEVLFSKNPQAVLPIASLTKLMTAVVITEAKLPLNEEITITDDDIDTEKNSTSRLRVGTTLTREDTLHLALMASENRAAHALGRTYPGGIDAFVAAMNNKARQLGMTETHYVEPTGLNSSNQSSAHDLAILVKAAEGHEIIREFSTSPELAVEVGNRMTSFHTTDALVRSPAWDILLQKTGYITEAGRCLVMQARMAGRKLIMVFLDSTGSHTHIADAERVRRWVAELPTHAAPAARAPAVLVPNGQVNSVLPKVAG